MDNTKELKKRKPTLKWIKRGLKGGLKDKLGNSLWFSLSPKLIGLGDLPKIGKTDISIRFIVDFTTYAGHMLDKLISAILKWYHKMVVSYICNGFRFSRILINVNIDREETEASFYVTFLYTTVPIKDNLNALHSILINDIRNRCPLNLNDIITDAELCLNSIFFPLIHGRKLIFTLDWKKSVGLVPQSTTNLCQICWRQ